MQAAPVVFIGLEVRAGTVSPSPSGLCAVWEEQPRGSLSECR